MNAAFTAGSEKGADLLRRNQNSNETDLSSAFGSSTVGTLVKEVQHLGMIRSAVLR